MEGMTEAVYWAGELESVFARVAGRFARADLRWRMRDYVRGLPAGRGNAVAHGHQLIFVCPHNRR
jgi:hypothetical protein